MMNRIEWVSRKFEAQANRLSIQVFSLQMNKINFNFFFFSFSLCSCAFSPMQLAEASKETYPDEEGSLSGSMISLAHSNSSTSFPAGSL